jgi:hypothetical protein
VLAEDVILELGHADLIDAEATFGDRLDHCRLFRINREVTRIA